MKKIMIVWLLSFCTIGFAQNKKQLGHQDFDSWNRIVAPAISNNGKWISHELKPGYGDPTLVVTDEKGKQLLKYNRGNNARFNFEGNVMVFMIKPPIDSLNNQRRNKVKEDGLLKDSLGIYNFSKSEIQKFGRVKSFKLPEKWGTHLAFQIFQEKPEKGVKKDTSANNKSKPAKKNKNENEKNGYNLIVKSLLSEKQDTFPFVKEYFFAEEGNRLLFSSTGNDSTFLPGVYLLDLAMNQLKPLCRGKGDYKNLTINKQGTLAAFVADRDTTKERIRPWELFIWQNSKDSARVLANTQSPFLQKQLLISENFKPYFSENSKYLFFGIANKPMLRDTMLLPEEIVNVEVWNYKDKRLYTQQNVEAKDDLKKSFLSVYTLATNRFFQIGEEQIPDFRFSNKSNSEWVLGISNLPYQHLSSWEGTPLRYDLYKINLATSKKEKIFTDMRASAIQISPEGKFITWFSAIDSSWYVHQNLTGKTFKLMDSRTVSLADEENDVPGYPSPYGNAGWIKGDSLFTIYDRYDIWLLNPNGTIKPEKITNGRENKTVFRYLNLYPEDPFIDRGKRQLLKTFNETTRQEGVFASNFKPNTLKELIRDDYRLAGFTKAENTESLIFSKENFATFPDVQFTDFNFRTIQQISHANPQQNNYIWGTVELYKWVSLDGTEREGLLYKPADFDPQKKYPMIVNFYEKSSDGLHRHIIPHPHRSTVNYSFYASRGYIIFVPDVVYRDGYPGESAYNSVMPGVTSLIEKGFVDEKRVGIQGHSWGAYQIAYILTRTNLFAAAEAGAPVPNMVSAYGGIRWETGIGRIFQYEHGQSRIGGSLWEYPLRYIENSPIFTLDKINTPVLLMHNDNDGHVPWYQGIEWFVSMRRLGKPCWMLNYNGEPHWPLKWQNQKDFNIRMQQFFDHYLMGAPMPVWMEKGVPATEKGITSGYELIGQ
jgi:dipeptidyl aminopeptidase/acylaminoacyl peptidase